MPPLDAPDADGGICAVPEGEGGFDSRSSDCQGLIILILLQFRSLPNMAAKS